MRRGRGRISLIVVSSVLLAACGDGNSAGSTPPSTATVTPTRVASTPTTIGTVAPTSTDTVAATPSETPASRTVTPTFTKTPGLPTSTPGSPTATKTPTSCVGPPLPTCSASESVTCKEQGCIVSCHCATPTATPAGSPTPFPCGDVCSGELGCGPALCGDFTVFNGICRPAGPGACGCLPFECRQCTVRVDPIPSTVAGLTVTVSAATLYNEAVDWEVDGGVGPVFIRGPRAGFTAEIPLNPGDNQLLVIARRSPSLPPPPCYAAHGPFTVRALGTAP